jgi:formylglycine-generating enzyme
MVAVLSALAGFSLRGQQVTCDFPHPFTLDDVASQLGVVRDARLRQQLEACGTSFILDDAGRRDLLARGASAALIDLLLPPPNPAPFATWRPLTDRREMRWVSPGAFTMGSPTGESGRGPDEDPRQVTIDAGFWLDRNEVTNEAYQRFVMARPDFAKHRIGGSYLQDWNGTDFPGGAGQRPVTFVTWQAATEYARWAGKRLPTEAEWEYAARAGTTGPYWWGGAEFQPTRANNGDQPWSVGQELSMNGWGFFDMLGNVWEWTSTSRPGGELAASQRIVRGGAFGGHPAFLRAAKRHALDPARAAINVGFRCAFSSAGRASADR